MKLTRQFTTHQLSYISVDSHIQISQPNLLSSLKVMIFPFCLVNKLTLELIKSVRKEYTQNLFMKKLIQHVGDSS